MSLQSNNMFIRSTPNRRHKKTCHLIELDCRPLPVFPLGGTRRRVFADYCLIFVKQQAVTLCKPQHPSPKTCEAEALSKSEW